MRKIAPLLFVFVLIGCKGSREKEIVGTWNGASGPTTISEDKKFTTSTGFFNVEGTWTMEGDDATLTPKTVGGKSIAEVQQKARALMDRFPANQRPDTEAFIKDLETPNVLTLSADGKTLTTNKSKDKNSGPGMTLTKA